MKMSDVLLKPHTPRPIPQTKLLSLSEKYFTMTKVQQVIYFIECSYLSIHIICKECGGSSLCKMEHCETSGIKKYNGYCLPCCIQVCQEIEVSRNYKTKEKDVVDRIKATFPFVINCNSFITRNLLEKKLPPQKKLSRQKKIC